MQEELDYTVLYKDHNGELRSTTYEKLDSVLHAKEVFQQEYKYNNTTLVAIMTVPSGTDLKIFANSNGFLDVV